MNQNPARIALVTCENLPGWEVDDAPLRAVLRDGGHDVQEPAWSDPKVDWEGFDICLIRTTWDYQERVPEFLAWAERVAACTRLENPLPVLRWNADKRYLSDLEQAGFPLAPTLWLAEHQPGQIGSWLQEQGLGRGFLKPCFGACARETLRFDCDPAGLSAAEAHARRLLPADPLMLQPYLPAVEEEGEYSLILFGGRPSHAVRKRPVAGDYRVMDDFGGSDEAVAMAAADWQLCAALLAHLQERFALARPLCYARIDLLRRADGVLAVNEVELIEPSLFFRHGPQAAAACAATLLARVQLPEL